MALQVNLIKTDTIIRETNRLQLYELEISIQKTASTRAGLVQTVYPSTASQLYSLMSWKRAAILNACSESIMYEHLLKNYIARSHNQHKIRIITLTLVPVLMWPMSAATPSVPTMSYKFSWPTKGCLLKKHWCGVLSNVLMAMSSRLIGQPSPPSLGCVFSYEWIGHPVTL